jgi:CrcB protein
VPPINPTRSHPSLGEVRTVTVGLLVAVAVGGLLGAPARVLVDGAVTARRSSARPWGTIVVNVTGSLVLGVLAGLSISHHLPITVGAAVGDGFCGAYTTFSTFSFETVRLVEAGDLVGAAANIGVSLVAGLAAAGAGLAIGLHL